MVIYDISRVMQEAPVYPGSPEMVFEPIASMANGDVYNQTRITVDSHAGTHADAFSHFFESGKNIDEMPLDHYCGRCRLITFIDEMISLNDLRGKLEGCERLVMCGGAFLSEEAAEYIAMCHIKLVVTDAISVGPQSNERAIHQILMEHNCAIIENAVLVGMKDGDYLIIAPPIKYAGCDGGPVRAIMISE